MNISDKYSEWKKVLSQNPFPTPEELFNSYKQIYKNSKIPISWLPDSNWINNSNLGKCIKELNFRDYNAFHNYSTKEKSEFWDYTIKQTGILFKEKYSVILPENYKPENPDWLQGAKLNIAESCLQGHPDQIAIIEGNEESSENEKITYQELNHKSTAFAAGLIKNGFKKGDRIVFYLPLSKEAIIAYLGIIKAGLVIVSVADSFSPEELSNRIKITNAKAVLTCDGYQYNGKWLNIQEKVLKANTLPCILVYNNPEKKIKQNQDLEFDKLLDFESELEIEYSHPQDTINILFSSGTTKEPKAIPWSHLTAIKCASDGFYHQDIRPEDIVTWTTGMGWMMAPWLIFATLINKGTIAIYTGAATTTGFGKFVEQTGITVMGTIPSIVKVWKANQFHKQVNWDTIRLFSSTGEPSNAEDYFYLMYLAKFRAPIIEYCGGTEIGGGYITGSVLQPSSPAVFTTPAVGIDFYLLNPEKKPVGDEEAGEVFLIPPSIGLTQNLLNKENYQEYYKDVPAGPKGEILRKHGDAFEKIEEGEYIFYKSVGRTDDAMNIGGIKISAVEIEEIINAHQEVHESAAVSVPDKGTGPEKLIIFLTLKEKKNPTQELTIELQKLITTRLNPLFRISEIIVIDVLPRTASNKIMRRELRKKLMDNK